MASRRNADGVFRHAAFDRGGPYLGDTLAMGQAALDLYAATGNRDWLTLAARCGSVINSRFKDDGGGFLTSLQTESTAGVFLKPVKPIDEQTQVVRFANRLYRYVGSAEFDAMAEHGGRYLAAAAIFDQPRPFPGILLVDHEIRFDPTHITIVGRKSDATAIALHSAARGIAAAYKRIDWWDADEGPLPNPDVTYPKLDEAAAFICTNRICSLPMFTPADMLETLQRISATNARPK